MSEVDIVIEDMISVVTPDAAVAHMTGADDPKASAKILNGAPGASAEAKRLINLLWVAGFDFEAFSADRHLWLVSKHEGSDVEVAEPCFGRLVHLDPGGITGGDDPGTYIDAYFLAELIKEGRVIPADSVKYEQYQLADGTRVKRRNGIAYPDFNYAPMDITLRCFIESNYMDAPMYIIPGSDFMLAMPEHEGLSMHPQAIYYHSGRAYGYAILPSGFMRVAKYDIAALTRLVAEYAVRVRGGYQPSQQGLEVCSYLGFNPSYDFEAAVKRFIDENSAYIKQDLVTVRDQLVAKSGVKVSMGAATAIQSKARRDPISVSSGDEPAYGSKSRVHLTFGNRYGR